MATTNKRKRDHELPRVTYHATGRTFDRLFKEDSLSAMQSVVRRKLGLAADVEVQLTQLRDGQTIDLEDDDDFDAFYSAAHSSLVVDVRVSERGGNSVTSTIPSKPLQSSGSTETTINPNTQTSTIEELGGSNKKKRNVTFLEGTLVNEGETPSITGEPERKKRKSAPHINEGHDMASTSTTKEANPMPTTLVIETQPNPPQTLDSLEPKSKKTKAVTAESTEKKQKKKSAKKSEPSDPTANKFGETRSENPKDTSPNEKIASSKVNDSNSTSTAVHEASGEVSCVDGQPGDKHSKKSEEDLASRKGKEKEPQGNGEKVVSGSDKATDIEEVSKVPDKEWTVPKHSKKKASESDTKLKAAPKKANKKASKSAAGSSKEAEEVSQPDRSSFDTTRATKDVIEAILARKRAATQTPAPEDPKVSDIPVVEASTEAMVEKTTRGTGKLAKTVKKPSSCPICSATPSHLRSKCPIIKGGIETMKKRVTELKAQMTDESGDVQLGTIQELQRLIEKHASATQKVKQRSVPPVVQSTSRKTDEDLSDEVDRIAGVHKKSTPLKGSVTKVPPVEASSDVLSDSDPLRKQVNKDDVQSTDFILNELIRGPKEFYSAANVPSSDEDEEVAETEEVEEDDLVMAKRGRGPSLKTFLPESSEEDDDEGGLVDADIEMDTSTHIIKNGKGSLVSPPVVSILSFQTVNDLGSSVEMEKAGDVAVGEALSADQTIYKMPESQPSRPSLTEDDRMSDVRPVPNSIGVQEDKARDESIEPAEIHASLPSSPIEDIPVEPASLIFKAHASQPVKGKKAQLAGQKPVSSWSPIPAPKTKGTARVDSVLENGQDRVARRTRTSTRASSQAVLLAGKEEQIVNRKAMVDEEDDLVVEKVDKAAVRRKSVPVKPPVKKRATVKSKGKGAVAVPEPPTSSEIGDERAIHNSMSKSMWETLPTESSPAPDGDGTMMVDELHSSQSSSFTFRPPLPVKRNGRVVPSRMSPREDTQNDGQRSPLFLPSESQVGFPFSQWEEVPVNDQANKDSTRPSPDDTGDEDEVQAAVMKPPPSQKLSQQYRRLTDIASQQSLFPKSPSLRTATFSPEKTKVTDLYGYSGGNERSDESDSDSDSASDVESHFPRARRAGIIRAKK